MSIPGSTGKISFRELADIPWQGWSKKTRVATDVPEMYRQEFGDMPLDLLWRPTQQGGAAQRRLFVLFSGDAMRSKFDPPVFQRWSWAEHFPGHCLYVSDPGLHLGKLGLAWYSGTPEFDPLPAVAKIVMRICKQLDIPAEAVHSYGSSGGGFAALRVLRFLEGATAFAVNPQTCITEYERRSVENYLKHAFGSRSRAANLKRWPDRISLVRLAREGAFADRRIVLMQNTDDTHHYVEHYTPFCEALGVGIDHAPDAHPVHRILFAHPRGHRKAETAEVFEQAMRLVTEGGEG